MYTTHLTFPKESHNNMEFTNTLLLYTSLLSLPLLLFLLLQLLKPSSNYKPPYKNLPPSPRSLPFIGHLHLISLPLHHCLIHLSHNLKTPILLLRFGSRQLLIVSSPSLADECFTKNDVIFANRPPLSNFNYLTYGGSVVGALPYGNEWRSLRRITRDILSPSSINALSPLRNQVVHSLVKNLLADEEGVEDSFPKKVDIRALFTQLMFTAVFKVLTGKTRSKSDKRLCDMMEEVQETISKPRPEDFFPFLKWFGVGGVNKTVVRFEKEMDEAFQEMVGEARQERLGGQNNNDSKCVIDLMLALQEKEGANILSDLQIKGMILSFLAAGVPPSAAHMEWVMALLLNNPEAITKIREEIDAHVGTNRLVSDTDLPNLGYLNNVMKETLRLYPIGPLLLPHFSLEDCTIGGYDVPKDTMLFVNAYVIHRDPEHWDEASMFKPERFDVEAKTADGFRKFFPFGVGRRSCPGEVLVSRVAALVIGALVQCYDWDRVGKDEIDMKEDAGLIMNKAEVLEVVYRPRKDLVDVVRSASA